MDVAVDHGVALVQAHGAVVGFHHNHGHHEHDGQQRIEVIGNGLDKQFKAGHTGAVGIGRHRRRPRADGRNHTDGGRCGVDDIRQFGTGDAVVVRHGGHHRAHGQAVEIVVDEDEHAQCEGGQLRAHTGFDMGLGPAAECGGGARLINQCHDDAQHHQEQEDAGGAADGGDEAGVGDVVDRRGHRAAAGEDSTHGDTEEQRGIHLFGNQSQTDGDNGRNQRPEGAVDLYAGCGDADGQCQYGDHHDDGDNVFDFHDFTTPLNCIASALTL